MLVTRTERGWAGHFICADDCRFRRNTLLACGDVEIVVSTVGLMNTHWPKDSRFYTGPFDTVGHQRYYETMAFHANPSDTRYHDADVSMQVAFDSPWSINIIDADDMANDMHEAVVRELTGKLKKGTKLE